MIILAVALPTMMIAVLVTAMMVAVCALVLRHKRRNGMLQITTELVQKGNVHVWSSKLGCFNSYMILKLTLSPCMLNFYVHNATDEQRC